jgi:uncharacterized CHY-type Zn-finger protein
MSCEIFISPFKGGTTSVAAALERVGLKRATYDWNVTPAPEAAGDLLTKKDFEIINCTNKIVESFCAFEDIEPNTKEEINLILNKKLHSLISRLDGEVPNVFDDWPLGHDFIHPFVKKIIFPYSKFIFLERPIEEYVESVKNHSLNPEHKHINTSSIDIFCKTSLGLKLSNINFNKLKSYYISLKQSFPNDVLIMDLEDGWTPLACFLDFEIPKEDFPWKNKRSINLVEPCEHELKYYEEYDSHWCPICSNWIEPKCKSNCGVCEKRPNQI